MSACRPSPSASPGRPPVVLRDLARTVAARMSVRAAAQVPVLTIS